MAKMTLLEMTQNILSAMDSDAVNSIGDTVESLQVADVIVETYYELFANVSSPSREGLIKLQGLSDTTRPNIMRIPDTVSSIKWIKYDGYDIDYVAPEQFLQWSYDRRNNEEGVFITDSGTGAYFWIFTNGSPTAWTTFDNEYIYFNGFDSSVDSTLQQSKSLCWGELDPIFETRDDAYPPNIEADQYPGLLAEAKSTCFINFKQVSNSKEEQKSKRQRIRRQNDEWRANQRKPYNRYPDYGRPGRGRGIGMDSNGRNSTNTIPDDSNLIPLDINFKQHFLDELDYE